MENDRAAQDRRPHGWPVGERESRAVRRGHRRRARRSGPRRVADVRRSRRRPGAPPVADRRRVPGAARPLRRGRLHPGAARAAGYPLHRLGRAGVGAGHEQGQGQGDVPARQPADRPRLRRSQPTAARTCWISTARSASRSWSSRAAKGRRSGRGSRATSWSWRPRSRRRSASTTRCWSNASSKARRSRSAILDGKPLGAVEIRPSAASTTSAPSTRAAAPTIHFPPRLSPERYRSVLTQAMLAHEALGC